MNNEPLDIIEFDVTLINKSTKIVSAKKTTIKLYPKYLTYMANYVVEEEYVYSKEDIEKDPILAKLQEEANLEVKKLKVEDEGLVPLDKIFISRVTENVLNKLGEGTSLFYKILLEYGGTDSTIGFYFDKKSTQIEVYNKLINWQITQNNW